MKKIIACISGFFFMINISAQQVPRTLIVEHFTNTYCSICANKNPGFYTNLNNHPDVLHIAYHPSVPYDECPFNQHNVTENDERTKYYNIFSGTPRLVIQGTVISTSQDYSSSSLFTSFTGQTSSFSMTSVLEQNSTKDSLVQIITITKEDASSLTELNLYSGIVEETINFSAQNGEDVHHDVFRKSFVGINPIKVNLPVTIGESINYRYAVKYNTEWKGEELKAITILQHDDKVVEQSTESNKIADFMLNIENDTSKDIVVFPTLFRNEIRLIRNDSTKNYTSFLYDAQSKIVLSFYVETNETVINTNHLQSGTYYLIVNKDATVDRHVIKMIKK
jgi:hypothetical protein